MEKTTEQTLILVGAPPPPYHGQAIMTEIVYAMEFPGYHVEKLDANFSSAMDEVGRVSLCKIKLALQLGLKLLSLRIKFKNPILYYCAGSANLAPLIRDAFILGCLGRLYKKRVVHFHSGGLPEAFAQSVVKKMLGYLAYSGVSASIALTEAVAVPCFKGTQKVILPNGLDIAPKPIRDDSAKDKTHQFLFVGSLRCSKGVLDLVRTCNELLNRGIHNFSVVFVGEWAVEGERIQIEAEIEKLGLEKYLTFAGRLTGNAKWESFHQADAFVFPTYYESENQPLVIIEAIGKSLPVISTHWRGIPEMFTEGKEGLLTEPKDIGALATAMQKLIGDPAKRDEMGCHARELYEEKFSIAAFERRLRRLLNDQSDGQ